MPLVNILLRFLLRVQASLPLGFNRWLGRIFGTLSFYLGARSARVTEQNLRLCFPDMPEAERSQLTLTSMQHTAMTAFETPSIWLREHSFTQKRIVRVENEALLEACLQSGRGTLILLPHLGNWEMLNAYFAMKGGMTALYHPPRQDWLKPLMSKIRGSNLVPTNRQGLMTLYKELDAGRVVTVLPDQVPASGAFAPFFGEPALTDRLVPRLLKKTGATALVCVVYRMPKGFAIRFEDVDPQLYSSDDSVALTALNRCVEHAMREHVSQYQWEYKRFRERPAGLKKLYKPKGSVQYYHE